jgi:hypothetical protein
MFKRIAYYYDVVVEACLIMLDAIFWPEDLKCGGLGSRPFYSSLSGAKIGEKFTT